jgi:hypothetical protein
LVAGTVYTAAQPNITSVGTLTGLTVSGTTNLGGIGNVTITGGAANYYLKTDGTGNLSWSAVTGGGGGGSITYTSDTTPPATGNLLGDQWFNTTTSVLYEYISDGTASYWVDISGATNTTSVPTTLNLANITISGGTNGQVLVSNGGGGLSFANITQSSIINGNSNVTVVANSNVTFNVTGTSNVLTVTQTGANLISNGTANLGNLVIANYVAGTLTTAAQPNITSVGTLANLTITGTLISAYSAETFVTLTGATGTVTHDTSQAATFYHTSPAANFVANFTNVTLIDNKISVLSLLISQGATAYIPTAMYINGSPYTIKWNFNSSPTGNANKIDLISYTLLKSAGVGSPVVIGQYSTFG